MSIVGRRGVGRVVGSVLTWVTLSRVSLVTTAVIMTVISVIGSWVKNCRFIRRRVTISFVMSNGVIVVG